MVQWEAAEGPARCGESRQRWQVVRFWLSLEGGAEMAGGQFAGDCGQDSGMILKRLSPVTGKL